MQPHVFCEPIQPMRSSKSLCPDVGEDVLIRFASTVLKIVIASEELSSGCTCLVHGPKQMLFKYICSFVTKS